MIMDKYGTDVNTKIARDLDLEGNLKKWVNDNYGHLLTEALLSIGKKRNVQIPITKGLTSVFGGCRVNYCAKDRKFDFIQYSVQNKRGTYYAKRIAI